MLPAQPIHLTAAESRVLGALVEKEAATPDYYPLSLNALINAPLLHRSSEGRASLFSARLRGDI